MIADLFWSATSGIFGFWLTVSLWMSLRDGTILSGKNEIKRSHHPKSYWFMFVWGVVINIVFWWAAIGNFMNAFS